MYSLQDGMKTRRVVISGETYTHPIFCVSSQSGDGFQCFYGSSVVCDKYESVNMNKFVARGNLAET